MMPSTTEPTGRKRAPQLLSAVTLVMALAATAGCSSSGSAKTVSSSSSAPQVLINGASQPDAFHDGQNVKVSMGANKVFRPYLRLVILECSDPGGKVSNLPTQAAEKCDVDTIQGGSLIPGSNGSFSWPAYTILQLPSKALNEGSTFLPVCNTSNPCVLYVGENYNDFSKPKAFSKPFTVMPGPGS